MDRLGPGVDFVSICMYLRVEKEAIYARTRNVYASMYKVLLEPRPLGCCK
jgi:hypothetical protein